MNETGKKTNWKAIVVVALVVLLAISFFKIEELMSVHISSRVNP